MNISAEKIKIIQQIIQIQDEALLNAVKNILDYGLKHQGYPSKAGRKSEVVPTKVSGNFWV